MEVAPLKSPAAGPTNSYPVVFLSQLSFLASPPEVFLSPNLWNVASLCHTCSCEGHCDTLVIISSGHFPPLPYPTSLWYLSLNHCPLSAPWLSSCLPGQALFSLLLVPCFPGSYDLVSPSVRPSSVPSLPFSLHTLGLGDASATALSPNTSLVHTITWSPSEGNPAQAGFSKTWKVL